MKRSLLCLFAGLCLQQGVQAQDKEKSTGSSDNERAVNKGQSSVNIYYGYRVSNSFIKALVDESGTDLKFKTLGPIGIVYEYMLTNVVGLGAEVGYGVTTVTYNDYYGFNNNNFYEEKLTVTNIRAQLRANFHFLKMRNFDMYGLVSAGYRSNTYVFSTTDPNYVDQTFEGVIPFGIKPGLGFRYFFDGAVGLHLEIAGGTPMLCGGLSFRF